ncbi:hypothetical protein VTH06DRAFT_3436 [Thermothelomyces fergusii]
MATNGNISHDQYTAPAQTTGAPANTETQANNLPKDEVGWYFVEQYYTNMSRSPDRLHLYYGKKAQFVCGRETEVVDIAFGRQAIQERIKSQDFQDCRVRVTNVDTQGSEDNILIMVIGEMANKADETKKFVQTFVLAQQPSGYFVLNDILRFLNDDVEEETEAPAEEQPSHVDVPAEPESEEKAEVPAAEEAAPEEAPGSTEAAVEKQEEAKEEESPAAPAPSTTEGPAETQEAPSEAAQAQADVERRSRRSPRRTLRPPPPPAQARAAAPAASQPAAPASQPQESAPAPAASKDQGSEWQTAETKRQSRAQPGAASGSEKEGVMAYIKYVTEKVQDEDLRAKLSSFGELAYFDINRSKNCAFVEFKTQDGYKAAVAANPHIVNGEKIVVEQRRTGASNYNAYRGGRGGRAGYDSPRAGSQGGGRGGFGQSRGRGGGARGRGGSQVGPKLVPDEARDQPPFREISLSRINIMPTVGIF